MVLPVPAFAEDTDNHRLSQMWLNHICVNLRKSVFSKRLFHGTDKENDLLEVDAIGLLVRLEVLKDGLLHPM
jgi:hypothetical protein